MIDRNKGRLSDSYMRIPQSLLEHIILNKEGIDFPFDWHTEGGNIIRVSYVKIDDKRYSLDFEFNPYD